MSNPLQNAREPRPGIGTFSNPMIKKLSKLQENSDECASYSGIFGKSLYFMVMILVGVMVTVVLNSIGAMGSDPVTGELFGELYVVIMLLAAAGIFLIFPFLAFLIRVTIPVTGGIYCIATGFLVSMLAMLDAEIGGYVLLALALTLAIVAAMGFLFAKGYIQVTQKFRAVTRTLFGTMVLGSLLIGVCAFIPSMRGQIAALTANPLLSIGGSVLGIVIATLFLLTDFDVIRQTVEDRLPKKYEWYASFGMVFTVVWLYFEVLSLLTKIKDGK